MEIEASGVGSSLSSFCANNEGADSGGQNVQKSAPCNYEEAKVPDIPLYMFVEFQKHFRQYEHNTQDSTINDLLRNYQD